MILFIYNILKNTLNCYTIKNIFLLFALFKINLKNKFAILLLAYWIMNKLLFVLILYYYF